MKDANELSTTTTNLDLNDVNVNDLIATTTTNNLKDADELSTDSTNPDLNDVNDWDKIMNDVLGSFQVKFTENNLQVLFMGETTSQDIDYKLRREEVLARFYTALAEVDDTIHSKGWNLDSSTLTEEE